MLWHPWAHKTGPAERSSHDLQRQIEAALVRVAALEVGVPPAGEGAAPGARTIGRYATPGAYVQGNTQTTISPTTLTLYYYPFFLAVRTRFDRIGVRVSTTGGASSRTRLGICTNVGGVPTAWRHRTAELNSGASGTDVEETIDLTLDRGAYFFAFRQSPIAVTSSYVVHDPSNAAVHAAAGVHAGSAAGLTNTPLFPAARIAATAMDDPPPAPDTFDTNGDLWASLIKLRVLSYPS